MQDEASASRGTLSAATVRALLPNSVTHVRCAPCSPFPFPPLIAHAERMGGTDVVAGISIVGVYNFSSLGLFARCAYSCSKRAIECTRHSLCACAYASCACVGWLCRLRCRSRVATTATVAAAETELPQPSLPSPPPLPLRPPPLLPQPLRRCNYPTTAASATAAVAAVAAVAAATAEIW